MHVLRGALTSGIAREWGAPAPGLALRKWARPGGRRVWPTHSPVRPLGVLWCVCGVLGHLAPVHRCARSVCCVACAVSLAPWLLFTGVPAQCVVLLVRCPGPLGSCSPVCPRGVLCCVCGVLGDLAPLHLCACSVCRVACAVSWAPWLLFTDVPSRCAVLRVRCPGPLGSSSPVRLLGVLCCVCGVLGPLAPVHRCVRSVCCVACAVSWATWLLFTGAPARFVVLRVRCPGPLGSCSPLCPLCLLLCARGVLGPLAPVHRCARLVCCVACTVSRASWLLFTAVPALSFALRARCLGPLGSCSPVCPRGVLCCVCGVLGHFAPVHQCARSVFCVACAVSWVRWPLFTGVPARCVVLRARCPGPLGSCSPVRLLGLSCCVCGIQGPLAPVHRCARSVCSAACAVSLAPLLLITGAPARCVLVCVRCPGPLGSRSPVCPLGVLCCVCGVLGSLAPVHGCARAVCCVACAVSWATWLLFTGVPARCVVLRVRCPGPLGSCSLVRPLGVLCCVCGVLGPLAPVHWCARSVCCVACAVSWATWLLFTGAPARFVVLRVRCPWPLSSCSPVCPLGVLCCVCGVLGPLAPVHRCARSVCCVACAVSLAPWLLFTGVPARCVVLRVRCPWLLGSCSRVCPRGVLCCVCGVLGHLAPVHRCARTVCCVACAVSWATWLLFTGAPAWCAVLRVRYPGPLGSCSPVCLLGVLCCVRGVLGHLAPVHRCARSACRVACTVSWAPWLLFTGAPTRCAVLCARCPRPLGSCSPVCPLSVLCCAYGVLAPWLLITGVLARCLVPCVACAGGALRGAHSSIRTAAVSSRQGLGTLWARTRQSGRWLFRSRQGLVCCRARTRSAGRQLVLLGTCSRAVVPCVLCALSEVLAPGGRCCLAPVRVPRLWPAACLSGLLHGPALVRLSSSGPVALIAPLGFPDAVVPFTTPGAGAPALLGGCAGHAEAGREPGSLCLPLAPVEAGALGSLRVVPVQGPAFFFFVLRPRCLRLSLVSGSRCPGPWRCVLFVLLASRSSVLCALSPLLRFPFGRWLLPGGCCPPRPLSCIAVFVASALQPVPFFLSFAF